MNVFRSLRPLVILSTTVALAAFCSSAAAQWMWKDEAGHTIASDQAPPPDTPASRILKSPRKQTPGAVAMVAPEAKADATKSVADRALDDKIRQKEQADAAKKADDDAKRAQAMRENCAAVKSNVVALQSGGRAARFNEKGEKVYIGDDERASEIARQQAQVSQYCKQS